MLGHFESAFCVHIDSDCVLEQVNESSVLIRLNDPHKLSLLKRHNIIGAWYAKLDDYYKTHKDSTWLIDMIVSYDTVLIRYDFDRLNVYELVDIIKHMSNASSQVLSNRQHQIDVCFDIKSDVFPNDLGEVCECVNLNVEIFKARFLAKAYKVFAMGFIPYFSYLGELDPSLSVPRLSRPRLKVPAGALAIADRQVAIYPNQTPGGWHIIAHTHFKFSQDSHFSVGDDIIFREVNIDVFKQQSAQATEPLRS